MKRGDDGDGGREALFKARRAAAGGLAGAEELQHSGCLAGAGRSVRCGSWSSTGGDGEGTAADDIGGGGGGGGGAAGGMEDDEAELAAALALRMEEEEEK